LAVSRKIVTKRVGQIEPTKDFKCLNLGHREHSQPANQLKRGALIGGI
jgi:hypothetical protein